MRMLAFALLLVLCAAGIPPARAEVSSHGDTSLLQSAPQHCGSTVEDAVKASNAYLKVDDNVRDHLAIACLTAVTGALNAARLDAVRDIDHAHVLAVPKGTADVQ
jgi:hypothetical protein